MIDWQSLDQRLKDQVKLLPDCHVKSRFLELSLDEDSTWSTILPQIQSEIDLSTLSKDRLVFAMIDMFVRGFIIGQSSKYGGPYEDSS